METKRGEYACNRLRLTGLGNPHKHEVTNQIIIALAMFSWKQKDFFKKKIWQGAHELFINRDFASYCINFHYNDKKKIAGEHLKYFPKFSSDKELVLKAIENSSYGNAIKYASYELAKDSDIIIARLKRIIKDDIEKEGEKVKYNERRKKEGLKEKNNKKFKLFDIMCVIPYELNIEVFRFLITNPYVLFSFRRSKSKQNKSTIYKWELFESQIKNFMSSPNAYEFVKIIFDLPESDTTWEDLIPFIPRGFLDIEKLKLLHEKKPDSIVSLCNLMPRDMITGSFIDYLFETTEIDNISSILSRNPIMEDRDFVLKFLNMGGSITYISKKFLADKDLSLIHI